MATAFTQRPDPSERVASRLARVCQEYLTIASRGEEVRKRDDRIGSRLWHGQHWVGVRQNPDRSAIVLNVFMALIHHIVSIMVKQKPMPIVEANDVGDKDAAELMRKVVMYVAKENKLDELARNCLILAKCCRTSAIKWLWDSSLHGGIGGIGAAIVRPWQLIMDGRTSDKKSMQFCGDRQPLYRSMAMTLYPDAAEEIANGHFGAYKPGSAMDPNATPVRDPWGSGSNIAKGAPTSINGKPVFTAYAGDPGFSADGDDIVEICEIYHKDLSLYDVEQIAKDHHGNELKEIVRDEDGMPQFDEKPPEMMGGVPVPVFEIKTQHVFETVQKRKYPHWRRTTMLMPDAKPIEDIAWDGPLPYAFFDDMFPMTGVWSRGSGLQLETAQSMLNVVASIDCDNFRFGSIKPLLAGASAALGHKVLTPGPGQVIDVAGDINQIKFLDVPQMTPMGIQYANQLVAMMERIVGAQGIMQGEAAGRVDSAAGYDMLAEIGGSRIVECTQRMESSLADCARIIGWFAQNYYTEKHAIAVEDAEGNITPERAWGPLLKGSLNYDIEVGSTLAWSESAKYQRWTQMFKDGIIDKIELWKRIGLANWHEIKTRMDQEAQSGQAYLMGPGGSPPPRTRQRTPSPGTKKQQQQR